MNNIRETVISPITSAAMIVSHENVVSGSVSHPPTVYIIYRPTNKRAALRVYICSPVRSCTQRPASCRRATRQCRGSSDGEQCRCAGGFPWRHPRNGLLCRQSHSPAAWEGGGGEGGRCGHMASRGYRWSHLPSGLKLTAMTDSVWPADCIRVYTLVPFLHA